MDVTHLDLRSFRNHQELHAGFTPGLNFIVGPNGSGKTSVVEALHLACTGRSFRTSTDRELITFGAGVARVELSYGSAAGPHRIEVALERAGGKVIRRDAVRLSTLRADPATPRVCVFAPDHLELVKGPAAVRRAYLDEVVGRLWPARVATRTAYARALAQRNSLLGRIRAGHADSTALAAWDRELARHGIELARHRADAIGLLSSHFDSISVALGLPGPAAVVYKPRSKAPDAEALETELRERLPTDLERGFTTHGQHRDDFALLSAERDLRRYGSQGQQRLALLCVLLVERDATQAAHGSLPVLLLDDVMSELDHERRERLLELLARSGQTLVTTADESCVPTDVDAVIRLGASAMEEVL